MSSTNMPIWRKDYFKLKEMKTQQKKEDFSAFPLLACMQAEISVCEGSLSSPHTPIPK